jgi:hypothetical protein
VASSAGLGDLPEQSPIFREIPAQSPKEDNANGTESHSQVQAEDRLEGASIRSGAFTE